MHGSGTLDDAIDRIAPLPRYAYHPREVAKMLDVSERYVCTLIDRGELPSVPLGRGRKVLHDDLMAFIQKLKDEEAQARLAAAGA